MIFVHVTNNHHRHTTKLCVTITIATIQIRRIYYVKGMKYCQRIGSHCLDLGMKETREPLVCMNKHMYNESLLMYTPVLSVIPSILLFMCRSPLTKQSPWLTNRPPATVTARGRKSVEAPVISKPALKSMSMLESVVSMSWPLLRAGR